MANYATLLAAIRAAIKANDQQAITGDVLQAVLTNIVGTLGAGYQFAGVATPATNPGTPDGKVWYLAPAGSYPNFGATSAAPFVVPAGSFGVFTWSDTWTRQTIEVASVIPDVITYAECPTPAATVAKVVAADNFRLVPGVQFRVKFSEANTAANPTLNIGGTGALPIVYDGRAASATNSWEAGEVVLVYYDGTSWQGAENKIDAQDIIGTILQVIGLMFVNETGFFVVDNNLNIGMKYDVEGLDFAKISDHALQLLREAGVGGDMIDVNENGFFVVDKYYNIGFGVTSSGLIAPNISGGASSSDSFPRPNSIITIKYTTSMPLPESKGTVIEGSVSVDFGNGTSLHKFATLEVQGATSQRYPKKNWTLGFFNDSGYQDEYKFRLANMVPHDEYVFKSSWIDATHCRNIVCNRLWEQMVVCRKGYPKRETEVVYDSSDNNVMRRMDTGALGHVDGFPAVLYVNGAFYGIGEFNIGKKRANYNMKKGNQLHILMSAEDHNDLYNYNAAEWEIRNPKNPDAEFASRVSQWFAANALSGSAFKDSFPTYHNLQNAIDYLLFIEFICAKDCVDKNFLLASWDGVQFSTMPYDLDTVFGLAWDGSGIIYSPSQSVLIDSGGASGRGYWEKVKGAYGSEISARYAELRQDIFTLDNLYSLLTNFNKVYGLDLYEQEFAKWPTIPSNTVCYTGIPQIMDWLATRIAWMDANYTNL